jgi:hypothetical protein
MLRGKKQELPLIGRKVYFKETRTKGQRWYIGTIIGVRAVVRTSSNIFGGEKQQWNDNALLIETSDRRKVSVFELDTFEVDR